MSLKQRLFVEAYLGNANGNASEAARIAGYANPGQIGYQLLQKTSIRKLVEKRILKAVMEADECLERLSVLARADLGNFIEIDSAGGWKIALRPGSTAPLRKLSMNDHGPVIEIQDPVKSLRLIGEHLGLWTPLKDEKLDLEAVSRAMKEKYDRIRPDGPPGTDPE